MNTWEKVIGVVREMMIDRGISEWKESPMQPDMYIAGENKILVYLCKTEKCNIESVKHIIYQLQQHKIKRGLVVFQKIITSSAKKAIDHLQEYCLEMFETRELQYNPTRHRLYSSHIRMSKEQIQKELPNMKPSLFPILLRNDMISRYFHFTKGDVVRIHRKNDSIAYRVVK